MDKFVFNMRKIAFAPLHFWSLIKLNKNWSAIACLPETVDEAVGRLMVILDSEQKISIANMPEDDLISLHFGLGVQIRNAFCLHNTNSKLLASCNTQHPDDASQIIIDKLWNQLRHEHH